MTRLVFFALFAAPFLLYAALLLTVRGGKRPPWLRVVGVIACATLAVAFVGGVWFLIHFVQFSGAPPGSTYVPAHIDSNGKFVPGTTK
jgi:nitrate reductase NapE component